MAKSVSRLRAELAQKSGHDFENLVGALLAEVMEGSACSKKLGRLDRLGIDAFTITEDETAFGTIIQCKGFELPDYGAAQHRQCVREIAKFAEKGPTASAYWLVVNRSIKNREFRDQLEQQLKQLEANGKVMHAELLDQEPLVDRIRDLATNRLTAWAEARRSELFDYYAARLQFVQYIPNVPFNQQQIDPAHYCVSYLRNFFDRIPAHQSGKFRRAPRLIVTSSFGFGKTSTLQALARSWIESEGHVIYAPAALLNDAAFEHTAGLARSLLDFLIPDDAEISSLGHHLFRDALRGITTIARDWILLIDGLDEHPEVLKPNRLAAFWGSISDLGIPAIVSVREELVESRRPEFLPDRSPKPGPVYEQVRLDDWTDDLIVEFVRRFANSRGGEELEAFRQFRQVIEEGRYGDVYGDIPKRPLFLGMLAQDAWSGEPPARQLHRLYGRYFRRKFDLDRHSAAAGGAARRPSKIVDAFGSDEAAERLISIMQDAARAMYRRDTVSRDAVHDTISEDRLREIATTHGISFIPVEEIAMHSLLQPAGRHGRTRRRLMRFAHRSFQDWFLARYFAEHDGEVAELPDAAERFRLAMEADIAAGESLP